MECPKPLHALDHAADQSADALLHFARRLVGEGDSENLSGPRTLGRENVREACRQNTSLSRSRTRKDEHRSVDRQNRLSLLLVEAQKVRSLALCRHLVGHLAESLVE